MGAALPGPLAALWLEDVSWGGDEFPTFWTRMFPTIVSKQYLSCQKIGDIWHGYEINGAGNSFV